MHIVPAARNYTPCGYSVLSGDLLGYNGHFQDPVSGLYPLGQGYRHFSPQLGGSTAQTTEVLLAEAD